MIYRSNLTCPDLTPAFKHTFSTVGPFGHAVLHDEDFGRGCGYMSHDEAAILANIAGVVGGDWVEIGTHTGWSIAHLALGGAFLLDGIDPQFQFKPFLARAKENLAAAGFDGKAWLRAVTSAEYFAAAGDEKYSGAVIDGCHSAPAPLEDAQMVLPRLEDRAAVVFHDFRGQPVREGVQWLINQGFKFRVYNTPQMLTVCWRGDIEMPVHTPDPAVNWAEVRGRMSDFDFEGEA